MSETEIFTENDLIAILERARRTAEDEGDPSALTTDELMALTGLGKGNVTRWLRVLIDAGSVECVRKPYVRIDGVATTRPAYRSRRRHDDDDIQRGSD